MKNNSKVGQHVQQLQMRLMIAHLQPLNPKTTQPSIWKIETNPVILACWDNPTNLLFCGVLF